MLAGSCLILALLVLVRSSTSSGSNSKFKSDRLSDYENCLVNLRAEDVDLQMADKMGMVHHLYNQSACFGLSYNLGRIVIPPMCRLGSGHMKVMHFAVTALTKKPHSECQDRAIYERPSLRSHTSSADGSAQQGMFISALVRHNFTRVMYIGDSITMQLAHFTACDLIRGGHWLKSITGLHALESEEIKRSGSSLVVDVVSNQRVAFMASLWQDLCVWIECSKIPIDVMQKTRTEVHMPASEPQTLVVVNVGLHLDPKLKGFRSIIESFAESLLRTAKDIVRKNQSSLVAFRETSGQHFSASSQGYYEHQDLGYQNSSQYCCARNQHVDADSESAMDFRDRILYARLTELDPDWRRYLLWIKFYRHSRAHSEDLHVEQGQRGAVDCTHYVYDPDYSDSISAALMRSTQTALDDYFQQKATWAATAVTQSTVNTTGVTRKWVSL